MNRKRILIVTNSFYPENSPRSFRATELTKELVRQGHIVTVLTGKNQRNTTLASKLSFKIQDLGESKWKPILLEGSGINLLLKRVIKRLAKWLIEYPDLEIVFRVSKALKIMSGFDMLISIAVPYPIHWGVANYIRRNNYKQLTKTWIADCGDPYLGQENDFLKPPFWFIFVEKWFMRKVDFITVPIESAIPAYFKEFHKKIKVIPQGFCFEEYKFKNPGNDKAFPVFGYGGSFIPGRRDPTEFIKYLTEISEKFEFHIYTTTPSILNGIIPAGEKRILVHSPLERALLLDHLSKMDFLVNFENKGSRQKPSKLIDYILLDKPVLSIKTGALEREKIDEFLKGDFTSKMSFQNPDAYRIENVTSKFLELERNGDAK